MGTDVFRERRGAGDVSRDEAVDVSGVFRRRICADRAGARPLGLPPLERRGVPEMTTRYPPYKPSALGAPLTALEEHVMSGLAAGRTLKDIEQASGLAHNACQGRLRRVRDKLGAETTLQAMYLWSQKK